MWICYSRRMTLNTFMKGSLKEYQGMTPERISEGILEINSGGFSGVSLEEFLKES